MANPISLFRRGLIARPTSILLTCVRCAGHSKWDNIRHQKTARDTARAKAINRHLLMIKAASFAGGFNVKVNDKLADAISTAKKDQVPIATIERFLDKMKNRKSKPFLFELIGPGSSYILIDGETDDKSSVRRSIQEAIRNWKGSWAWAKQDALKNQFRQRGVVKISRLDKDGNLIDYEQVEEIAIEAGAEEVIQPADLEEAKQNKDPEETWDMLCDKDDLFAVKAYIEKNRADVVVKECCLEYFPSFIAELEEKDLEKLSDMIDAITEVPDVSKIFVNVK